MESVVEEKALADATRNTVHVCISYDNDNIDFAFSQLWSSDIQREKRKTVYTLIIII